MTILFSSCFNSFTENNKSIIINYKYLALGDSYTYGEAVCDTCNFPSQLLDTLNNDQNKIVTLLSIAQTGWTTTDLINELNSINPPSDFDLVTLLIGVNNQFQRIPFSVYEEEFPLLWTSKPLMETRKNLEENYQLTHLAPSFF